MSQAATAIFLLALSTAFAQTAPPACPTPPVSEAKPWLNAQYSPECRARFVLAQLKTLDEKFAFLGAGPGGGRGGTNPLDNLGLHRGGGSDGPAGVRAGAGVTAFPTPLSIAATFDPAMGARFGDLMGQDFFDAALNGITGPAIDITRTWHFGRSTESFGEDPFLAASIVGPEIAAIQAHKRYGDHEALDRLQPGAEPHRRSAHWDETRQQPNHQRARAARDLPAGVPCSGSGGPRGKRNVLFPPHQRGLRMRESRNARHS